MESLFAALLFVMLMKSTEGATVTDNLFLDVSVDNAPVGTVHVGLFGRIVKNTARTVVQLATDGVVIDAKKRHLAGTAISRIVPSLMIEGGDCSDESGHVPSLHLDTSTVPQLSFDTEGIFAMSTTISNVKGCQFFITINKAPWLTGKYIPAGKVLDGMNVLNKLTALATNSNDVPINRVRITASRHTPVARPFFVQLNPPQGVGFWAKCVGVPAIVSLMIVALLRRILQFLDPSGDADFDEIAMRQLREKALIEQTDEPQPTDSEKKSN